jgi:predicted Zn-dependent protease
MAHTHLRSAWAGTAISLRLFRGPESVLRTLLGLALTAASAHGQTLAPANPHDLLTGDPAAFAQLLEEARPKPLSAADKARILARLPAEGEITDLSGWALQKLTRLGQLLEASERNAIYEVKVVDVPQARIGLYARTVVLITEPALRLLDVEELQALVAHEVGHEYVWAEYERSRAHSDSRRVKTLELVCDGIAAVIVRQLGLDPGRLIAGIEKMTIFNRQRFGPTDNEHDYPTVAERRAFVRAVDAWITKRERTSR